MPEEGDCDALIRWYYKPKRDECRKFDEGDCEGDNAFFRTKAECLHICKGASNEPGSTAHTKGGEGEAPVPSTSGQGTNQKQEKGEEGSEKNGGAVATKRPGNITGHGPKYTPPMSTTWTRKGMTEAQRRIAEAKRRREQLRKELEAKRKEQTRKHHIQGSCGSRPRKGACDGDTEKWWFDGYFRVCKRVKQGECTNWGAFFESCRDCMNRCNRRDVNRCIYWE
ncbi:uncharacterized protein LOC125941762 [Dermacentor silvarum]|uniref:uncharacterized protein LOC125941762 n=1 Tax=Dermacentor silvarum TaxID=543639 RepID=UPI0021007614|nr:uncharacterized protein LOC125941762 [Dermacentor silvarum]